MKIVVLNVPALHLGYLGFYGNSWVATPNLDRLASQAVVFDRHYAGGRNDLYTGCYDMPFPEMAPLPEAGPDILRVSLPNFEVIQGANSSRTVAQILEHVHRGKDFIWAEFRSLAPPWRIPDDMLAVYFDEDSEVEPWPDPPTGFLVGDRGVHLERLQNTYAALVTYFDARLGSLVEERLLDDWLVCLTSGQGLPLGEHGYVGQARAWQHEESVHVPLLLRWPGHEYAGQRIGALTQPVDLVPTLRECQGWPPGEVEGKSLLPLVEGKVESLRPFACSGAAVGASLEWSLRTLDRALLLPLSSPPDDPPRRRQLYIKPDDRWEVNDVQQHHHEQIDEMEANLRAFMATMYSSRSAK